MKKLLILFFMLSITVVYSGCKKYLDINKDPDRLLENQAPMQQVLTSVTTSVGFTGGSDLFRYAALIMQQFSGQTTGGETQTQAFEKYLIQATDLNNLYSSIFATILNDIEVVIRKAGEQNSPHYAGVAKLLKAYTYHIAIDAWGDLPFSESQQTVNNLFPKYDNDEDIYKELIKIIDAGIADINQATSVASPGSNSTIYTGSFATKKANWIKFGNTLKLRLFLHYSKFDKTFAVAQITSLVNSAGVSFFAANADNFEMPFLNEANRQNSVHQFELNRANYLFSNKFMVDLMNTKVDPRRQFFFTQFPAHPAPGGKYKGGSAGDGSSQKYSRMHTYLRGATVTFGNANATDSAYNFNTITYTGDAPTRMLTFAEYNFIRAEAALYGAPGNAQTFFEEGIKASMKGAGVADPDITMYLTANGTLAGTDDQKLKQIIEEKYVANYGVIMEPWTDWRRTGYPQIVKASNAVLGDIPRSLLIPQSEVDLNRNAPKQKSNMLERVFWDKQ